MVGSSCQVTGGTRRVGTDTRNRCCKHLRRAGTKVESILIGTALFALLYDRVVIHLRLKKQQTLLELLLAGQSRENQLVQQLVRYRRND